MNSVLDSSDDDFLVSSDDDDNDDQTEPPAADVIKPPKSKADKAKKEMEAMVELDSSSSDMETSDSDSSDKGSAASVKKNQGETKSDVKNKRVGKPRAKKKTKLQHKDWWKEAELIENVDDWEEHLKKHGYAVKIDVLNSAECQAMKNGLFAHAEKIIPGFKSNNKDTWKKDSLKKVYPSHGMLMQQFQWGNTQAAYDVRQNPKVAKAFEVIWEDETLTSSLDGVSFGLPPESTGVGWEGRQKGWLHCDQSFQRSKFECVQGWVTANNVERGRYVACTTRFPQVPW